MTAMMVGTLQPSERMHTVRFDAFEIRNYKGIALAQLDGLASEAVVTISGRNGTGKSLLLEAIVGCWAQRYSMPSRVGPWGDELSISLTVHLTEEEWAAVDNWHTRFQGGPAARDGDVTFQLVATRAGNQAVQRDSTVLQTLRNPQFQREYPFSVVDFLPANRLVPSTPSATVDLGLLNVERVEQERWQMLDQFINQRAPMSMPSVSNYLVTLDYQAFLAARQGLAIGNEYERLADSFLGSTGKSLLLPEYDPARGSNIEVQLPAGQRHSLGDLSSGEQEMLAMMYFVRRLSAAGGVLCIDEPEQHLHPTLQASLFEAMQGMAERAQVLVVSHSVNLISAAPLSGLVQLKAPSDATTDQVQRLEDQPGRVELVAALGITPADLFQSDVLLVVEGDTDSQWLRSLFPVEMGRAHVMVAGSRSQVIDAHETLIQAPTGIPWLCLIDRDLMSDDEVRVLTERHRNLHVWPRRAFESVLLDAPLIVRTLTSTGKDDVDEAVVERWLIEAAETLKDEVLAQLVDREVSRKFPAPPAGVTGSRYERMEEQLRAYADVNRARADAVQEALESERALLDVRWATDWPALVNPKPVLAQTNQKVALFKTPAALISALVARAREDDDVRPTALNEFRARLNAALTGQHP